MALDILRNDHGPILGVLFDMDGVVIDSERLYTRFWMAAAADLGFPMTLEQALQLRSLGRAPGQAKLESFFGPTVSYDKIRARRIELMDVYIAEHGVDEKPGIRALLVYLKEQGIPCAITSSSAIPVIRQHLGKLGLLEYFTALCSGKDVPRGKPAPDIYLEGARAIGVAQENCLAIEDSPAGLEAGWRAGCMGIFVPDQDQPDPVTLSRCTAKADSLYDVLELIRRERNPDLSDVVSALGRWLKGVEIPARILVEREDALRVIFETENVLAELTAGARDCAPCRFVSFQALDTRLEPDAEPVFCFYDDESHTIGDILRELDRGTEKIAGL